MDRFDKHRIIDNVRIQKVRKCHKIRWFLEDGAMSKPKVTRPGTHPAISKSYNKTDNDQKIMTKKPGNKNGEKSQTCGWVWRVFYVIEVRVQRYPMIMCKRWYKKVSEQLIMLVIGVL